MTKKDLQKAEKIASESAQLAKRALAKSDQLHAYLSLLEHKEGKTHTYKSPKELFKKLKLA
jgi:hypothetical protein